MKADQVNTSRADDRYLPLKPRSEDLLVISEGEFAPGPWEPPWALVALEHPVVVGAQS